MYPTFIFFLTINAGYFVAVNAFRCILTLLVQTRVLRRPSTKPSALTVTGQRPPIPPFPSTIPCTWILTVEKTTIRPATSRPIPLIEDLRQLKLNELTVLDGNGQATLTRFNLTDFTRELRLPQLIILSLEKIKLGAVKESDFVGFTGLTMLTIDHCDLDSFDRRTFYPLAATVPGGASLLESFSLWSGDAAKMTAFPWDALFPVAESIQNVAFFGGKNLANITFNLPEGVTSMTLRTLTKFSIEYTGIKSIPAEVVATFNGTTTSAKPHEVTFRDNANRCESCELVPLMYWARNPTATTSRLFNATCVRDPSKPFDKPMEYQTSVDYWKNFPVNECKVSFNGALPSGSSVSFFLLSAMSSLLLFWHC